MSVSNRWRMTAPTGELAPSNEHRDAKAEAKAAKAYAKATRPWFKKKRWWLAGLVIVIIAAVAGGGGSGDSSDPPASKPAAAAEKDVAPAEKTQPKAEEAPESELTAGQEYALAAAENYLDTMPFSRQGAHRAAVLVGR
jgi:hypothetical protein